MPCSCLGSQKALVGGVALGVGDIDELRPVGDKLAAECGFEAGNASEWVLRVIWVGDTPEVHSAATELFGRQDSLPASELGTVTTASFEGWPAIQPSEDAVVFEREEGIEHRFPIHSEVEMYHLALKELSKNTLVVW
jgi:hypothetical protein